MVQQSPNIGYSDDSSQVLWEDGERVFSRGWRLDDNGNRRAVLLVAPAADHPSPSTLDRLTHEYELKDELDRAWAAQPLALMRDAGRTVLVLDDLGGEPLDRLLGLAEPFLAPGSECLFLKGERAEQELTLARKGWTMTVSAHQSRSDPRGVVLRLQQVAREHCHG